MYVHLTLNTAIAGKRIDHTWGVGYLSELSQLSYVLDPITIHDSCGVCSMPCVCVTLPRLASHTLFNGVVLFDDGVVVVRGERKKRYRVSESLSSEMMWLCVWFLLRRVSCVLHAW